MIPEDCRAEFGKREDKPIWPAHLNETQARAGYGKWLTSVEERIAAIRERAGLPGRTIVTDFEIERLAQLWYAHLLQEDEDLRNDGLSERKFRQYGETVEWNDRATASELARGDTSHLQEEIEDFVRSHGFELDSASPEHRKLSLRLLKEYRRAAKASVERQAGEIVETRVMDPACGTGNFLYVAMEMMKRLEGEVLEAVADLGGQEALMLEGHTIDPHQFLGMEVNPRAAAIAELVVWIGFLQWHFRTKGAAPAEPILKDFRTIKAMDAVVAHDGKDLVLDASGKPETRTDADGNRVEVYSYRNPRRPAWPEVDYIVGTRPLSVVH